MKKVDKDRLEFQMYGYKGRFNKTNKEYKELKDKYNKLEQHYQNALNNCSELFDENQYLQNKIEMQNARLSFLIKTIKITSDLMDKTKNLIEELK